MLGFFSCAGPHLERIKIRLQEGLGIAPRHNASSLLSQNKAEQLAPRIQSTQDDRFPGQELENPKELSKPGSLTPTYLSI